MRFIMFFLVFLFTFQIQAQQVYRSEAVESAFAYSGGVGAVNVSKDGASFGLMAVVTNVAPAAGAFTCAASNICTKASHGYLTGLKIQASTTTTLPGGLSPATDYFVIYLSANTFSLATSLVNALVPTAIDITDAGTGTHTITPTALAGASVVLQCSMDGVIYDDIPIKASGDVSKSASITATANIYLYDDQPNCNYIRAYYALTAGQLSVSQVSRVKLH